MNHYSTPKQRTSSGDNHRRERSHKERILSTDQIINNLLETAFLASEQAWQLYADACNDYPRNEELVATRGLVAQAAEKRYDQLVAKYRPEPCTCPDDPNYQGTACPACVKAQELKHGDELPFGGIE